MQRIESSASSNEHGTKNDRLKMQKDANRNPGPVACAPSGFPNPLILGSAHQRSKTPLGAETEKSVFCIFPLSAVVEFQRITRSGGEAFAAGAMRDRIRVGDFKTALLQVVTEIED